tara:strand:- start:1045 stop:1230 length:186 start_codon:yes stop_codon:yes gene_type:complete
MIVGVIKTLALVSTALKITTGNAQEANSIYYMDSPSQEQLNVWERAIPFYKDVDKGLFCGS